MPRSSVETAGKEIEVFEISKQSQICGDDCSEDAFPENQVPASVKNQSPKIIESDGKEQQYNIFRLTPGIEKKARSKQEQIAALFLREEGSDQDDRKKYPEKRKRTEDHSCLIPDLLFLLAAHSAAAADKTPYLPVLLSG